MPLISVIVPVFNGETYLQECIDSILAQTLTDIEIIVVDDGSTDNSPEICREYQQRESERFRYFFQKNAGQASARNTGLDHACGKYIAFCDADDVYPPTALETLATQMNNCDIAVASFSHRKSDPKKWSKEPKFRLVDSKTAIRKTLYQHPLFNTSPCSKLFRAELFENNRFENGLFYEDLDIIPRLYSGCAKIAISGTPLYFYRQNPNSFINTWHPRRLDAITASENVLRFMESNYPDLVPAARSRRFSAYFNMFAEASRHGNDDIVAKCYTMIKQERAAILSDPNVRIKNKIGAVISYLGRRVLRFIAAI